MNNNMAGWGSGLIGVIIFGGSLPATRVAIEGFSPFFLTSARAAIAGFAGMALLVAFRQPRPTQSQIIPLILISLCVVIGFPLLTAMTLQHITAARSIVFIGLLPLATAVFGIICGGEKPAPLFWLFACLGSLSVVTFALSEGGKASWQGDLLMVAAIIICGLGYAEGAVISRKIGGWQVICWALVIAMPAMIICAAFLWPSTFAGISPAAWGGLAYVSLFSMLIGFFFWYRGLAIGGIAGVGQLQLLQPFFGLLFVFLFLGEAIAPAMFATTIFVVFCVAVAKRFA